ncbi:MAG: aspartate aminotransferase family protein [Chiayiivirga sp.]|jgi:beta-alanine--pyruvate transaminase|uniref:aspartate aminotransferase family protein n=1 Tax=Chiayiivirga sp. TaxID=2041042 RepID=UPI0025BD06C7|nr:aspartate aminotransferase family protein [Chiayiivirga sp.]MCI1711585.1 aspartate aminotransferase family protein [Chiayiivirga sp.]MCI1730608.1 aspartate aminotransferase family protein [Chiayiivirga sp.]
MTEPATASIDGLNLDPYWMPFTHNRYFKARRPLDRLLVSAEGAYYTSSEGKKLFDGLSGLWCSGLGHGDARITEAVKRQLDVADYVPSFQVASPDTFRLAERIAQHAPDDLNRVFFTNSGSEAVDTAIKIAIGYHRLRGEASRTRIIGREKAYHGVGLGGISVGGMVANRKMFAPLMMNGVDHLPHTHSLKDMAFSKGQPAWGAHLADELERIVALHDASTIAAVIVEPMQGSVGVIIPPLGYLQKLREICSKHGILLIFDEVITGFGRMGEWFGAQAFGVTPDLITFAKGVNNGTVPMGGVIARQGIYDAFMQGPDYAVELFHGYTYSAHPLAVAAAHATLDILEADNIPARFAALGKKLEAGIHSLRDAPNVIDIRNFGTAAAVELAPIAGKPGWRAIRLFEEALTRGLLVRFTGDTIALAPPVISTDTEIDALIGGMRECIRAVA